ncbi:MAG: hypothetical protein LUM44_05505 [Pyrinomonadaceae bacterium]|nr:hypothetical protein [Pyrinomonadaceae bacterium]
MSDAKEDLEEIIEMFDPQKEFYEEEEFKVRMAHLYRHLNSAWNRRNITAEQLENADGMKTNIWGEFPKDIKPI